MKKITALVLALTMVCSLFAMAGYAEEKKEIETVTPGVLTVATSPDFAPYEFYALRRATPRWLALIWHWRSTLPITWAWSWRSSPWTSTAP